MSDTISVVIATYGDREWIILANDRSVPSAEKEDPDEMVLRHLFEGTRASSLNQGAEDATEDWLIFLDADDELAPGYVGAMRRALEQHRTDGNHKVLFTPAVQHIRKGRPRPPFFFPECSLETGNWLVIGTMIRREFFLDIGGFHEHPHGLEDWNLWARAVRTGARIVKVPGAVYRAHMNPTSKHHALQRNRPAYMQAYEAARADAWG